MKPFTKGRVSPARGRSGGGRHPLLRCSDAPKKSLGQNGNPEKPQPAKNKLIQADKHICLMNIPNRAKRPEFRHFDTLPDRDGVIAQHHCGFEKATEKAVAWGQTVALTGPGGNGTSAATGHTP